MGAPVLERFPVGRCVAVALGRALGFVPESGKFVLFGWALLLGMGPPVSKSKVPPPKKRYKIIIAINNIKKQVGE